MAITLQASPAAYSSVHDDLIYTVAEVAKTADPVTYPNYKFVADVYVGGVMKARIKKAPHPDTRIGIFNIGQIVRNYISTSFNPTAAAIRAQELGVGEFKIDIVVKFGEEYAYTTYTNLTVDVTRTYFNNYNGRLIGLASSLSVFEDKVTSNRTLTGQSLLTSGFNFVPFFPTSTGPYDFIVTPTGGGIVYTGSFTPTDQFDLQILNISPVAINAQQAGTITAATTSYTVLIGTQLFTVELICEALYQTFTIHFLNKYGGFESKIFSKVSRKTLDITRKDYGRLFYNVDSSGVVSYKNANGVYNESRSTYASQYKEKLTLNSDLLTDGEYRWLSDLILSPLVYIEDGAYFYPVVITDNNYEPKKNINDELSNLTINVEYGQMLNAQYR
jgi:hypothetical protein